MATLNVATKTTWDASIPEWWDKKVMDDADRESIVQRMTGPDGSDAPVLEKVDLTKQKGDKITFTVLQRLIGKGVSSATALEGAEETIALGVHTVTVDLFRHATAANEIATTEAIFDFPSTSGRKLSEWLARFLDDRLTNQVVNTDIDSNTTIYGGDATSRATLAPGDILTPTELRGLHMAAERRGVRPFRRLRTKTLPFPVFGALLSEVDYYNLAGSDDFEQDFRLAQARSDDNAVLSGYTDMYKGITLWRWASVNPGDGMLGNFLRPEARLAATITSAGTTVTAGPTTAVTNVDYWQYFPVSGTNTLLIDDEQISYTAVPGDSSLTVATRGANGTTAAAHTAGALMTLNNVGKVLLFGQNFAMQAWAKRPERIRQERDYAMELGLGIKFLYEVKGVDAADGSPANCFVLEVYGANPNTV